MPPYEFSERADEDYDGIMQYTLDNFGEKQMVKYSDQLIACLNTISDDKAIYKKIENEGRVIRSLHCQKHYIFGLERKNNPLLIIAIFHERMNLLEQLKNRL